MEKPVMLKERFDRAVQFIKESARPLERALFAYEFEAGSSEEALRELAAFQNSDGGFGHGLEPDVRLAASSVLATSVALQHLTSLKASCHSPLVQGAIRYLVSSYDTVQKHGWDIVPAEAETAPRAPWWNYNAAHDGWGNPAIELVGYFHAYSSLVPASLLDELTQHAITYMNEKSSRNDFHELLCCLRFAELVPASILDEVKPAMDEMVRNCVTTDPRQWDGYCLSPVQAAETQSSLYYGQLRDSVFPYLSHLLAQQHSDGSWSPSWGWAEFQDVWPRAERDWKGVITLDALRRLKAYGIVSS
ncbi:hypothetical protein [Paenibacillus harenae]|uniref:hypothetical protein n=1 Tax=Paenibacillus harenae TaxID=306543 RepID=UPI0004270A8E|nr:hypothetical protein [Paenibacillus harenae]